ncbi:MAG: EAL domain-containing protein [Spirochaetes bacterium]|nr:EAL domain-containing protein [Spirochaetota bacterium]
MNMIQGYQILEKLEETSGSRIYRARTRGDPRTVIIKEFKWNFVSPSEIERCKHEYEIIRKLSMEGAVKIHEIISYENTFALILEDFNGISISKIFKEIKFFDVKFFLEIAIKVVDALGEIHKNNIIHRDIKPKNILLNREEGRIKITEFGFASFFTVESNFHNPDIISGTLSYMSPEQSGRLNRVVDYRSDIYSLGITFYEMLSGAVPFQTNDPIELVYSHIARPPAPLSSVMPDVPVMLSSIIMKMLNKIPDERYQNALGIMHDLKIFRDNFYDNKEQSVFQIGLKDIPIKCIIPQLLIGRDKELKIILNVFAKTNIGSKEVVFVSGQSGIGKSALVNEIQNHVVKNRGYFITGKYDPFRKDVPYSAIRQAFQGLIRQILAECQKRLDEWKQKFLNALGSNGKIITDIVPNLETLIGVQPFVEDAGHAEMQNRFDYTFKNFVRVFAQKEHAVVFFLDDLQWADTASITLLGKILCDKTIKYLLIIGAYRESEIAEHHPFNLLLKSGQLDNVNINNIKLSPLDASNVKRIILNFLKCDETKATLLADLIYKKTNGNPFFINQFLKILYDDKKIYFNKDLNPEWDTDEIGMMAVTDNVVELLAEKIISLPPDVIEILKICSCIGNRFDLNLIADTSGKPIYEVLKCLEPAIEQDYITFFLTYYKFNHDRIQEAIYSLIPEEVKSRLHYKIGKHLLEKTGDDAMHDKIIFIADQWNRGLMNIIDESEKLKAAEINFYAGEKSKLSTAYESALNYFKQGLYLLPDDKWNSYYDLTLRFFNGIIESEYYRGNYDEIEKLYKVIESKAVNILEKINAVVLLIHVFSFKGEPEKGIKFASNILKELGYNELILNPSKFRIIKELIHYNIRFRNKLKNFLDYPIDRDPRRKAIRNVLHALTYISGSYNSFLAPLIIFKHIIFCFQNKVVSEGIATFVASLANVILVILKKYDDAYEMYQLAFRLNEKYPVKRNIGYVYTMYAVLVIHWKKHQKEAIKYLDEAYKYLYESGSLEFAVNSIVNISARRILLGNHADEILRDMKGYGDIISNLNVKYINAFFRDLTQLFLWMTEKTDNKYSLNTADYIEEDEEKARLEAGNENSQFIYLFYKLITRYLSEQYAEAYKICKMMENYKHLNLVISEQYEYILYYSLTLVALLDDNSKNKRKYRKILLINQKKMKIWADNCKENFLHRYLLISAEIARLKKDYLKAESLYCQAVALAGENQYVNIQAVASELAGKFYHNRGIAAAAHAYLADARYFYSLWGADIKVSDIEYKYPEYKFKDDRKEIIKRKQDIKFDTVSGSSDLVDVVSVVKASQAISGEVEPEKLLNMIMKITIQNAGAERGLMILENAGKFFVEAEYIAAHDDVKILNSLPLEDHQGFSSSIVNYVIRAKEKVILNNAFLESDFNMDPYVQKNRPKSILCAPILNQGRLIGVFYLENNLSTGAFTEQRLQILSILSSQMAISIENAKFYEKLEKTVRERTSDLTKANEQLLSEINERKKMEERIRFLAYYDQLTELPNRTLFNEKLNSAYSSAKRKNRMFAVMFLDVDNFKRINDSLGHSIGDMLIREVSKRLMKCIRKEDAVINRSMTSIEDTVARIGGDEFTILLSEIKKPENVSRVAERIRNEFILPVELDDKKINVTVSMGIAVYPFDGNDVETLIKNADIAMYNVKSVGKNDFQYYNNTMNKTASQKLFIESEINKALGNEEFTLYYQPLIEIKTKRICGAEALIRWRHPDKGIIPPMDFIPIAEEAGLIVKIGEFVLDNAFAHYNKWAKNGCPLINIAVNISPKQLADKGFFDLVRKLMGKHNMPKEKVIFEITENSIIYDFEEACRIINGIKELGIKTALDDFGSGNSSFGVLKKINLDILKIDRSFIMNIPHNSQDSEIISSLITIGHSMNLLVVAEGVENKEQLSFLESRGCDKAQGYYFSPPVPEAEFVKMLAK